MKLLGRALVALPILIVSLSAEPVPEAATAVRPGEIVDRYLSAVAAERRNPEDIRMDMEIDAKLPRLKKSGKLHALKFVSKVGQIVYRSLRFEGDDTVKKDVIARYLTVEREARNEHNGSMAITPENYKFKYKGTTDYAGDLAYVFQLTPKKKRVGLFKGELWIDSRTFLPLREWGELVKNPSVFLKSVYFVRDYLIYDGRSVPRRVISDVDTRLVGKAELTVWFDNYCMGDRAQTSNVADAGTRLSQVDGGQPR